jgi:hypothetical protein
MIKRMAAKVGMHPAEVVAFQVGEIKILQSRPSESAIGRKIEFLAFRIVN